MLFVSGSFSAISGQSRNYIADFDASSLELSSRDFKANAPANDFLNIDQDVYLGGLFTNINNSNSSGFVFIPK